MPMYSAYYTSCLKPDFKPCCQDLFSSFRKWVSSFGHLWIKDCSHLPTAYRSVPRPSSPLIAKAFTKRPYVLEQIHADASAHNSYLNLRHVLGIQFFRMTNLEKPVLDRTLLSSIRLCRTIGPAQAVNWIDILCHCSARTTTRYRFVVLCLQIFHGVAGHLVRHKPRKFDAADEWKDSNQPP